MGCAPSSDAVPGKGSTSKQKKRKSSLSSSSSNDAVFGRKQNKDTRQTSIGTKNNWVTKATNSSDGAKILKDKTYNHDINNASDSVPLKTVNSINKTLSDRNQSHEERAKYLEQKRAAFNYDKREEITLRSYNPPIFPLNMKDKVDTRFLPVYTVDHIVAHNKFVKSKEFFRMGRRVFCWTVMLPIVENRLRDIERRNEMGVWQGKHEKYFYLNKPLEYPPYLVRRGNALSRKELAQVLCCCVIGKHENVSRDRYVSSLKESVEYVLEELRAVNDGAESDEAHFKNQLTRWLNRYPDVPLGETQLQKGTDPNSVAYKLPKGVDPSLLRAWVADFVWDTQLDPNIWDNSAPAFVDLCKDSHNRFAGLVARNSSLPDFDHTIEGAVAWREIEQDLFKNDVLTPAQEEVWKKRSKFPPKSEALMEKRRNAIAVSFYTRHEWKPNKVTPYLDFVNNLRKSWAKFQELCLKPWYPPPRKKRRT